MNKKIYNCQYFGECGGCTMRDIAYPRQLRSKQNKIAEALSHCPHPPIAPILPSPVVQYYRNKMEFAFGVWDEQLVLGLRERGRFYHVIDVRQCYLQSPMSDCIREAVRKTAQHTRLEAFHRKYCSGVLRYLVIREGKNTGECMVHLITSPIDTKKLEPIFLVLKEVFPAITTIMWSTTDTVSDVAVGTRMEIIKGKGIIKDRIGEKEFMVSPYSFFQTNTSGAEVLYEVIKKYLARAPNDLLLDIYCGSGGIGLYAASRFKLVIGIESNRFAVDDARRNTALNNIHNYQVICENAENILFKKTTFSCSNAVAVVDPPRAGLGSAVIDFLCDRKIPAVIYVSCNIDALKRDLQRLTQYYKITGIQPIDLFPHTPHVETVVALRRKLGPH